MCEGKELVSNKMQCIFVVYSLRLAYLVAFEACNKHSIIIYSFNSVSRWPFKSLSENPLTFVTCLLELSPDSCH